MHRINAPSPLLRNKQWSKCGFFLLLSSQCSETVGIWGIWKFNGARSSTRARMAVFEVVVGGGSSFTSVGGDPFTPVVRRKPKTTPFVRVSQRLCVCVWEQRSNKATVWHVSFFSRGAFQWHLRFLSCNMWAVIASLLSCTDKTHMPPPPQLCPAHLPEGKTTVKQVSHYLCRLFSHHQSV